MEQLQALIAQAGSMGRAALLLDVPKSTVSSWQRNGALPSWRLPQIEAALRTLEGFSDLNEGRETDGNA